MPTALTAIYTTLFLHHQVVQPVQSVTSTLTSQTLSNNGSAGDCPPSGDLDAAVQSVNQAASNIAQRLRLLPQCGEGYWYQVLDFDVNSSNQTCPSGLTLISEPVEGCGRESIGGCDIGQLTIDGMEYSRVCGRITGRASGTPDGFALPFDAILILTKDASEHIWTFVASSVNPPNCPCSGVGTPPPPFTAVGNDYFCDFSGLPNNTRAMWTGENCTDSGCCSFNSPPYFTVDLPPTTEDIIVAVCRSAGNIVIARMQLFVQ